MCSRRPVDSNALKQDIRGKSSPFHNKHFDKLRAAFQLVCTYACRRVVAICKTLHTKSGTNLSTDVNCNMLELSLIAISKLIFLFIISSLFLTDPVPDQYVVFGRIIAPYWEIHNWTVSPKIFGTKRDKATGDWRKLHSEELHDLYCSPHLIRVIKLKMLTDDIRGVGWGGCGTYGEEQTCTAFMGKPEVKRPLGRQRCSD